MITAEQLRREFTDFMDANSANYTIMDQNDNVVFLAFGGDQDSYVMVDFDETEGYDAESVHFSSHSFARIEQANLAAALIALNDANARYRWVKFYMLDNMLCADSDATIYPGNVGDECVKCAIRMSNIIVTALKDDFKDVAVVDNDAMRMLMMIAALKHAGLE